MTTKDHDHARMTVRDIGSAVPVWLITEMTAREYPDVFSAQKEATYNRSIEALCRDREIISDER